MPKEQFNVRLDTTLKRALQDRANEAGQPLTQVLERYISEGLARDKGATIEASTVPVIRAAIREEMQRSMETLTAQIHQDVQQISRRDTDRLAALTVKAARSAGIGQRLVYTLLAEEVGEEAADRVFERAVTLTAKELVARSSPPPSSSKTTRQEDQGAAEESGEEGKETGA
ncbi:hypothetical protein [Ktedonobacter racemifer]|uniref:Uncharacterized protein n=1 Tax=Ktedonobacter racemifer DSM 44963 TaxID=485913 RepID=D6U8U2_KTERA|nr:hypothetical protein [Ktedonobacter racemifer]EFH79652.1 hypothetical protein Krac_0130 [Ktedonobacter racemifer DSM 44963]